MIRRLPDRKHCVFHGHPQACIPDHGKIVIAVTAGDHLLPGQSRHLQKPLQALGLIDAPGKDLQEKRL